MDSTFKPGEAVLIHGGTSGIGSMAVQMLKTAGASKILVTAGSAEKCQAALDLGADIAINYREQDFEEIGRAEGGVDIILDMIGGDYVQKNISVARLGGRIVNIAYMSGFKSEVNFAPLLMKRLTLTGSTLRAQTFEQKAVMVEEITRVVYPHLDSGAIRPVIDSTFPLADAQKAHDRMESGEHMGKIILTLP